MSASSNLTKYGVFPRRMREDVAAFYMGWSTGHFRLLCADPNSGYPAPLREGNSKFWLKDDLDRLIDRQFHIRETDNDNEFEEFKRLLAQP